MKPYDQPRRMMATIVMITILLAVAAAGPGASLQATGSASLGATLFGPAHVIADQFDGAHSVYAEDLDGDGDVDVLATAHAANTIAWWQNDGSGNLTRQTLTLYPEGQQYMGAYSVTAADIDSDGAMDILGAADDFGVYWWRGSGTGDFEIGREISNQFWGARSVYAIDLQHDGDTDVVGAGANIGGSQLVVWWENDGAQNWGWWHPIEDGFTGATSVYATDIDGDGYEDVLAAADVLDDVAWWKGNDSGGFTKVVIDGSFDGASSVYAADIDSDGWVDVLGAATEADEIAWWKNNGDGTFAKRVVDGAFDGAVSVYAADLDGDGDLDLVGAARNADQVAWWENDGSGNWTKHGIVGDFDGARSVYAADMDGDGDLDLLGAAEYANQVVWWENTSGNYEVILFTRGSSHFSADTEIYMIRPDGSGLTRLTDNGWQDWMPRISPDGRKIAFCSMESGTHILSIMDIETRAVTALPEQIPCGDNSSWSPDGTQLVAGGAHIIDLTTGEISAVPNALTGIRNIDWSPDGLQIALVAEPWSLHTLNIDGTNHRVFPVSRPRGPSWSPDGQRIAYESYIGRLCIVNSDSTGDIGFSTGRGAFLPRWSPDGTRIAYATLSAGQVRIINADGSGDHAVPGVPGGWIDGVDWGSIKANSLPTLQVGHASVVADEGQTATNAGTVSDPDGDEVELSASVGTVTPQVGLGGDPGVFLDSGQDLGGSDSRGIAVGDLDGDGDLDAFVVNIYSPHKVWLNDGGTFTDSGQSLSNWVTYSVALGDVDGDGDLDAFVGMYGANEVWLNDGSGVFTDSGQNLGSAGTISKGVTLGDLDGDGDLDVFVVNHSGQASRVWLNDGQGTFTDSGQSLSGSDGYAAALGDVDGDHDLDAFVMNGSGPAKVWLNNGSGSFTDSAQSLGSGVSVALGDVDGDGDLDAFVGVYGADKVWLNDGSGVFTDSGQSLGSVESMDVSLSDVDGDGDLDAFVVSWIQDSKVWLNDGTGNFADSGQALAGSSSTSVALGDADGDGDLDAFVANSNATNKLWINQGSPAVQGWSWSFDTTNGPADSQTVTITADDGHSGVAQVTFDLTVNNVAPTIETITVPLEPVSIGDQSLFGVDVTFSDPAKVNDEPYTCAFDLDSDGVDDSIVSGITGTLCSTALNYTEPGVYTVRVTVTDKDGGKDSATVTEFIVVYDPEGGFVTGGGWIDSPEGAYTPDASLTGKATFGFVAKYKKGANVPTGETEFQFKVGGLNFHSESYQWLVVAGPKAQYKGEGTINGAGTYGFMLTAVDAKLTPSADVDLFRIKIWDKATGETIYDNQLGAPDDDEPTTAIGGGSIVIHKK